MRRGVEKRSATELSTGTSAVPVAGTDASRRGGSKAYGPDGIVVVRLKVAVSGSKISPLPIEVSVTAQSKTRPSLRSVAV